MIVYATRYRGRIVCFSPTEMAAYNELAKLRGQSGLGPPTDGVVPTNVPTDRHNLVRWLNNNLNQGT